MGERAGWRTPVLRVVLPVLWLAAVILFAVIFASSLRTRANKNDFAVYYAAALEMRNGVNPYTTDFATIAHSKGLEIKDVRRSTEPPTFLLIFEPLTRFSPATAFLIWQAINLLALVLALVLLLGPGSGLSAPAAWTAAAIAIAYPAVLSHFWFGQSKLPLLLIMVVMTRLMRRGFDASAGVLLAFAGLVRIYPFAVAGYLVFERRWRALAFMTGAILVGGLATLAITGPALCIDFVHGLSYLTSETWSAKSGDNAPLAFAIRVLGESGLSPGGVTESFRHALLAAIDIVFLALTIRATLLYSLHREYNVRPFSLWVATAIVLPPVCWDYDMTLLILPFAAIAIAALSGAASRRTIAMAIASYLLICVWRFSGIGDAEHVAGPGLILLKESVALSLLTGFMAAYWFALDGAQ